MCLDKAGVQALPLWQFLCLMYPFHDCFNDNKVFVGQPIQQRIHAPPYGTFDGIPIFEYVPVKGNVKHGDADIYLDLKA